MSRRHHAKPGRARQGQAIDRQEAAALLRAARAGAIEPLDDSTEWALTALPGCRHARRLAIQRLLQAGDTEAADALITQGLLIRPTDPLLTRLRAESLFMQGETRLAEKEIGLALDRRAHHCATLLLAARIAAARGDHPQAVALLQRAEAQKPHRDEIKAMLTQALLDAGCVERAEQALHTMDRPAPALCARVLAARGRLLEAIDLLEAARLEEIEAADQQNAELLCELIDLLERVGDMSRLRRLLEEITIQGKPHRAVLVRVGVAWLTLGAFATAIRQMALISRPGPRQRDALAVLVVAAAMAGRGRLAERALRRLQQTSAGTDPVAMADLWRRALTARLFSDQYDPQKAGADRNASLLQPLLHSALETFSAEPASREEGPGGASGAELNRHRAMCLAAMGRSREAAAIFPDALPAEEPPAQTTTPRTMPARRAA
jgi:tetratricopeptide (TPR) repeat protein